MSGNPPLLAADAILSACGQFRYRLWRRWAEGPTLVFVMLNPSTADATTDDPTIRKCIGFAERLGFGAIDVVNLFAHRATDPKALKAAGYPVGPENDYYIAEAVSPAGMVICAWGANARGLARPKEVLQAMRQYRGRDRIRALRLSADGVPWHPLMLPYSCLPEPLPREAHGGW